MAGKCNTAEKPVVRTAAVEDPENMAARPRARAPGTLSMQQARACAPKKNNPIEPNCFNLIQNGQNEIDPQRHQVITSTKCTD